MLDRVVDTICRCGMFPQGARVGVAVSGGADSVCLLHVLDQLQAQWGLTLSVIHINHLLRASDSEADELFVRKLAEGLRLPLICERVNVRGLAVGANLEQTARDVRRAIFRREIEAGHLDRVAVAHTRSDQAETVLFRFLRGSYTTGLAGMRPVTTEGIVRPLLEVDRGEVEKYLTERNIPWREDLSNQNPQFARNRIRHHLMPELAAEWNPNLPRLLAQHARLAQEDETYWDAEVERLAPGIFTTSGNTCIADVRQLEDLPVSLIRRLIRRAFLRVRGDLRQIDFGHIDSALDLVRGKSGHYRTQVPGVDVLRSFDWVRFAQPPDGPVSRDFELVLQIPGRSPLPGAQGTLYMELVVSPPDGTAVTKPTHVTLKTDLDWNRIQSETGAQLLMLRNWRPGDAYQPVGDQHEHKLKTLFHEARIPLWERRHWPVVTAGGQIIWSRRFGPASHVAADAFSGTILRISELTQAS